MEGMFVTDILLLESILDGISEPEPLKLSFLEYMTDNFSENRVAGRGGFGVVYKGDLKNRNVAVKKLTFTNNAEKEFDREIINLLRVRHKNIVWLLGYCNNRIGKYVNVANPGEPERISSVYTEERIICLEYISNGSLTAHIHDELRGLEWDTRYKIVRGICQALDYLHNEKRLVHRDLKPDNILIDNLMAPKIADLGISKLLNDGLSKSMTTNASATWEYAAPEFADRVVSVKYDIYSLGIIIIEIVTGFRRAPDLKTVLTRWRHRWNKSNDALRYQQVGKCIEIGLSCQNKKPKKRPFISKIINDLNDVDGGIGAVQQEIPCWNELLWVEPPELFFPFQINKQMSCSLELHNNADAYMAFFIKTDSDMQYDMDPRKGVIQPHSNLTVSITLLAQEESPEKMWSADEFTIKCKKLNEGPTADEITKEIFSKKTGDIVDKVRIGVVFDAQRRAGCMVEEEPKEHQSLHPLAISDSQVSGGTSCEAEPSTQSVCDLDKEVVDFPRGQDKKQFTSLDDWSIQSGTSHVEVYAGEPTAAPPNSDDSSIQSGTTQVQVNDEEPTVAPPNPGTTWTPTEPWRVQLVIKSNKTAPLLEHKQVVMLELTGSHDISDRPGLDLVLVVDVGSNVPGEKMKELQRAMMFVVVKLSPIDRLSIVTYSHSATELCFLRPITETSRLELLELIYGIKGFAHTSNIEDGLMTGLKVLAHRNLRTNRVAAIILICHNRQSTGNATKVSVANVPVYTFGFGRDSDHIVLSTIAANSMGGTFSHIQDEDLSGGLTMALSQCLAGLLTVSVQDLELTVEPVGDETSIVKTTAGSYQQRNEQGGSLTVMFGNLYSREVRKVVVDLRFTACNMDHSFEFLKVTCTYNSTSTSSSGGRERFVRPLTVWRTDGRGVHTLEEEKLWLTELQVEKARLQAAELVQQAVQWANVSLEQAHQMLVEAQNKVMLNPLLTTELQELNQLFQTKETYMKQGSAYAFSLVSSHNRQRYAARGSNVEMMRVFATPCMDMCLEEAKKIYQDTASRYHTTTQETAQDTTDSEDCAPPGAYLVEPPADNAPRGGYFVGRPADNAPPANYFAPPGGYFVGDPADGAPPANYFAPPGDYFVERPANYENPSKQGLGRRLWPWRRRS